MKRKAILALMLAALLCAMPAMAAKRTRVQSQFGYMGYGQWGCNAGASGSGSCANSGSCVNNGNSGSCVNNSGNCTVNSGCGNTSGGNASGGNAAQGGQVIEIGWQNADDGKSLAQLAQQIVDETNAERRSAGLNALSVSSELTRAACVRAGEIVKQFAHTRPDGSAWSTVSSAARGENIAKGQQTVAKVMAAWMSSSGHRANILRASFGSIGVCAYRVGNTMYWVQLFGK